MNIPMPDVVQPVSFLDYANQFAAFDGQKQRQRLIDMQMQQMPRDQEIQERLANAKIDSMETGGMEDKHKLAVQVATGIYNSMSGMDESDPMFQQKLEQVSRPLRPMLSKLFNVPDDPNKPTDWNGIKSLAMTGQGQQKDVFQPVYDANGNILRFSHNTGIAGKVPLEQGGFMESSNKSPAYNAAWKNAGEGQSHVQIENDDGTKSMTTPHRLNPQAFPIQPSTVQQQLTPQQIMQLANEGNPQAIAEIESGRAGNVHQAQGYGPTTEQQNQEKLKLEQGKAEIENQQKLDQQANQKTTDAKSVLELLDEAEGLVDKATGSLVGSLVDKAGAVVGKAPDGAAEAAQMQMIEGTLVSKMPKMTGPQSDKDVMLYKQMAGRIGDPTVPKPVKKAAMVTLRKLNEKYAGEQPIQNKLKPGTIEDGHRFKGGDPSKPENWEAL